MSPNFISGVFYISVILLSECVFAEKQNVALKVCPDGWSQLKMNDSTNAEGPVCVKIYSKPDTFLNAATNCRKDGGDLATILNNEYQEAVHKMINKKKHWIGLSDFRFETSFVWTSGFPAVPAAFWAPGQPNDGMGHQDCIAVDPAKPANQSWFDEDCTEQLPFVCMKATFKGAPKRLVLENENGTCPKDFFRVGNRCMRIITKKPLNFTDARDQCKALAPKLNGDLASIYTAKEQNMLTAMIRNESKDLWIGLHLNPETSTHVWVRGLYNVVFTNWKRHEPNGDLSEQCVMMYKRSSSPGEWNDQKCDIKLGYICGADLQHGTSDQKEVTPFSSGKCKEGEVEYDNHCYKSPEKKFSSYKDAEEGCQKFNKLGHIATPHNAFEIAFISLLMNHLKINYTLLGFQIKETSTEFGVITADNTSDIGFESLKGIMFHEVNNVSCVASTGNPQHKVSVANCVNKTSPFKILCNYPLKDSHFHPENTKITCPKDWLAITGGRCIKYFDDKTTMSGAMKKCKAHNNGSLISILNAHDQQAAVKVAKVDSSVWIGLEVSFASPDKAPSWRWFDNRPVLFLNWRANEPSPTSRTGHMEMCVVLRRGSRDWNNVRCSDQNTFICSMQGTPVTPTTPPSTEKPLSSSTSTTMKPTSTPTTTPATSTPTTTPKPKPKPKPTPTTKPVLKCPTGFEEGPKKRCYRVVIAEKTWRDAEKYCNKSGNHLVSIHSHTEQLFVNKLFKKFKVSSLWIGLSDLYGPIENQFSYWSDGSPLTVMFMNTLKTSHFGKEDCVVFSSSSGSSIGEWKMRHCTLKAPGFICMRSLKTKPVPSPPEPKAVGSYCYKGFVKFNSTCYKLVTKPETYVDANKECKKMFPINHGQHVNLARINNVETNDFLLSLLSPIKNGHAWIGMHYRDEEFHWIDNRPVHFTKWPVNMTNTNKKTTCVTLGASTVTILSGFWYARNCHEKLPYLCQSPLMSKNQLESPKCKGSYTLYPDGKTCYRRLEKPTTFEDGRQQCEADKKNLGLKTAPALLSIDSVFEMSFFRAWMMETGAPLDRTVWVGLKLEKDKPVWKWTNGAPVDFTYSSGLPDDISGCYYTYVHRKIENDEKYTNVYGMHPDPKCGKSVNGKRTAVCKYYLEPKKTVPNPKKCLATKDGIGYIGHQAVTKSGKACVRWDTLNDISVLVQLNQKISGSDSNFCRNPHGKPHQRDRPYCYTTRGKSSEDAKWEYCDIPLCPSAFAGHVGSHSYVVAVAILVIVLLVTISFFVGVMLWRRTNTARGFIPYLRQHDPEGGTSFHNPIYTPAANC